MSKKEIKIENQNHATSLIEVKDLEIIYKTDLETVYAVNGISFKVNRGETLGIVGETGAGKSTSVLSLLRLLPERTGHVVGGKIMFNGEDIAEFSSDKLRAMRGGKVAMIFQDPMTSLNPVLTIGEQIEESLVLHNKDASKEEISNRVDEVLSLVGISPSRKGDYPHQFSGGMRQRVVIAMALSCEPDMIIADEPTTALDVTIQAQVLSMMRNLRDTLGTAMIMITHDLGIVAQTCDNVAVMYAGKFIEVGTSEEIFLGDNHHPYTVGLFGSIPNLREKADRLNPIPGLMPDPTEEIVGCSFAPRCPKAMDICKTNIPTPIEMEGTHKIACPLFDTKEKGGNKNAK